MATFQELSDIANNAGQPELVYKLMELSTTSAMWNTRKGVAFALAGQSRAKLEAHLSELLPTLYRYTFDPNPRISQAMKQVWSALVPDPKRSISAHLPAVLDHLMDGITSREWRAREASCFALADVLSGRTYDELTKYLTDMHKRLMRAVDDIKESVRKAAMGAWRALSSVINRLSDGALAAPAQAEATLGLILPTLLEQGISHSSDEVRSLCTKQLLQLCKAAGPHMRPHVVQLVPALLETLSVLEDPALNYLQQHAESAGVAQSALESARVAAMRGSDATAAIDACLRVMDAPQFEAALPSIISLLTRGTGLPTRAGTARLLVQISQQQPLLLVPHAARLLRTLHSAAMHERSEAARSAYNAAAAQVARGASTEVLTRVVGELCAAYTSDEGGVEYEMRFAAAAMVRELLRAATDAMNRVQVDWVPLVFLGKHESRTQAEVADAPTAAQKAERGRLATLWLEAYDEAGIGKSKLTLHLPEIVTLLTKVVNGPSWALRRAAAFCLLELHKEVTKEALARQPIELAAMGELAALLRDKKWRDKEGEAREEIEKLGNAVRPPARRGADGKAIEEEEEADSGDM